MNNDLRTLYAAHWPHLCAHLEPIHHDHSRPVKPTCPLLLTLNDGAGWETADLRLIVYGQETNGWHEPYHSNLPTIQGYYDDFFHRGKCWSYGGQFWNGVARFRDLLQHQYPEKKISVLWNNLIKIGKEQDKGSPPSYIYELEQQHFSVLAAELEILRPTVALFLTGPNYDGIIARAFANPTYGPVASTHSERQLAQVSLPGIPLAFRTYHPNYLWRKGINGYFQPILDALDHALGEKG